MQNPNKPLAISSIEDFNNTIKTTSHVIIDFYADWCPPCKMMAPKFDELSSKFTNVAFRKVNIDSLQVPLNIKSIPTFILFEKGVELGRVIGGNVAELERLLTKTQR